MRHRHRVVVALAATLGTTAALLGPVAPASAGSASARQLFPTVISLPDGFQPEGIAIGALPFAYFGSRAGGSIYRANLVTGTRRDDQPRLRATASLGHQARPPRPALRRRRGRGDGRVVDARTGDGLDDLRLHRPATTFVNDVVLTPSTRPGSPTPAARALQGAARPHGTARPTRSRPSRSPATSSSPPGATNANGIARTPDGRDLLVVQSNTGLLFRVDPRTGARHAGRPRRRAADQRRRALARGPPLYVVQNRLNQIAVVDLNRAGTAGHRWSRTITSPTFDVPTTVAASASGSTCPTRGSPRRRPRRPPYTAVAVRR